MKHATTLFLIFLFPALSFSQPHAINYQGVARNGQGLPLINHNISLRLSILDSSATGQAVYVETQTATTSNAGLFNISIGSGTVVSATFNSVPWGKGEKWLKTEMDTSGGSNYQLIGTTQFLSVPYALHSKSSDPQGTSIGDMQYWNGTSWVIVSGGSYGQTLNFCNGVPTWGGCLPILTTTVISNISSSTGTSGGNISSDGGASVTSRGVCWSTSPNPTTANDKTTDGSGSGTFTSNITGLTLNTTYYVRAYATNARGNAYGNENIITTLADSAVAICNQVWMSKNLDVDRYRNGDPIPKVTDPTVWANLTTGAYCYFNNDSTTYAGTYGKLYNWYAVNDLRGLAPIGWHIPSDTEWTTLENCLGGVSVAGGKMKETGTAHWNSPNTGATNSSGFTGLPGGYCGENGAPFFNISIIGYFWSYTLFDNTNASAFYLVNNGGFTSWYHFNKRSGFSVRCLKD